MTQAIQELQIEACPTKTQVKPAEELQVEVKVSNVGDTAIVVNQRGSIGYEDSFARELYCTITEGGGDYQGYNDYRLDYRRPEAEEDDLAELKPGSAFSVTFDLQEWYRLAHRGTYRVTVWYHPDESDELPDFEPGPGVAAPPFDVQVG